MDARTASIEANGEAEPATASRRLRLYPLVEIGIFLLLIAVAATSYFIVTTRAEETLLSPPTVAGLLVANLVPAMALMVLIARRLAMGRAARSEIGGRGRLHVRLVAIFSVIASVPTLMVVIFASLLFQGGLQFWFSDKARQVLGSAENVSQIYAREHRARIELDVAVMGADMVDRINQFGLPTERFTEELVYQTAARQLAEGAILTLGDGGALLTQKAVVLADGEVTTVSAGTLYDQRIKAHYSAEALQRQGAGQVVVFSTRPDRVEALVRLDPDAAIFFYGAREISAEAIGQIEQARTAASDYQGVLDRSRSYQLQFHAALLIVSLLIVGISIAIALALADRLVRPVGQLVNAARQVSAGNLSARVPSSKIDDEIGTLGEAFNSMTGRLERQTGDLVLANEQLESRRAFSEAVLSGVTAGVISVDADHVVRLANPTAESLLRTSGLSPVGRNLADVAPELADLLNDQEAENIIQFASRGEPRTLAVKTVTVDDGHVLTFDDITDQLIDQRRAAWSDVARRIAHEIKNPLTPIQLAAERLQRRYGNEVSSDPSTFERLTGTIVRQVGDLRRMVDEFSSFARMPKPVFGEEAVAEIARQALFLHEVAHPNIRFILDAPNPSPILVCDRRLLGQALTNVVKNGVEAIQQKREEEGTSGEETVALTVRQTGTQLAIEVTDTGIGLPADRKRLTEPYMTTRVKGTGLGLAIVKKIVEDHFGGIAFEDAAGGGTCVRLTFDTDMLARIGRTGARDTEDVTVND